MATTYTVENDIRDLAEAAGLDATFAAFGDRDKFEATLDKIVRVDARYGAPELGRDIMDAREVRGAALPPVFDRGLLAWKEAERPSLPALAIAMVDRMGIPDWRNANNTSEEAVLARAAVLTAMRAELNASHANAGNGFFNPYHNSRHTGHVAVMTDYLLNVHSAMVMEGSDVAQMSRADRLTGITAAFSHDIDHPGTANPANDPLLNEEKSFAAVQPLLASLGVSQNRQDQIHTILQATSPNGPHEYLKKAAAATRNGQTPDPATLDPKGAFPSLDVLCRDRLLREMTATIEDADLYISAGAGMRASAENSSRLTQEFKLSGVNMDCMTDKSRLFFLDAIVGKDGFASPAARLVANDMVDDLRRHTVAKIAAATTLAVPPGI